MSEELPEPWRSALAPKGVHSRRGLATKAGIAPQTAVRLVNGQGIPRAETITAIADAFFGGDRNQVRELAGLSGRDYGEFQLPPEASLLRPDQREAVRMVIQAMLPDGAKGGEGDDRDAPSTSTVTNLSERQPKVPARRVARKRPDQDHQ